MCFKNKPLEVKEEKKELNVLYAVLKQTVAKHGQQRAMLRKQTVSEGYRKPFIINQWPLIMKKKNTFVFVSFRSYNLIYDSLLQLKYLHSW